MRDLGTARRIIERARRAKAESRRLIEEARRYLVPVTCTACGGTLYWHGERPPYVDPRCARCRNDDRTRYSG